MVHLGDITKINGAEIEPVWCITGGSPCQDLSIAGKRAGLAGARSGLFMEQVRIVKEMREADKRNGRTGDMVRPRYLVWENVVGAFSSNKGKDFAAVLEEIIKIVEPEAPGIEVPEKGWPTWGGYHDEVGGRWSVVWRTHDSQYWGKTIRDSRTGDVLRMGTPQRRRRISVVADFGGDTASEIQFDRKSVSGDIAEGGTAGEGSAEAAETSTSYAVRIRGGCDGGGKGALVQTERSGTLGTGNDQTIRDCGEQAPALQARMGTGGNQIPLTYQDVAGTLSPGAHAGSYNGQDAYNDMLVFGAEYPDVSKTLRAKANCAYREDAETYPVQNMVVRRLTPLECTRLQGYPEFMEMNIEEMTKDEYIAANIASGQIVVDCENGKIYTTKGPGGKRLSEPRLLAGTNVNGYRVVSIRNGDTKLQCRVHRVVWIAKNGIIPEGYVIDHINNDKADNRISNLQLLTPEENSHKAHRDGRYLVGDDNPSTKLPVSKRKEVVELYRSGEMTTKELSEKYGICKSRVQQIVSTYGWVDIGDWVDENGKKHKDADSPKYKALGNSIALPFWEWMLRRMARYLPEGATLGSLFDGIGGFPLAFERIHGRGMARWASEIEQFPIVVTKKWFGEE